MHRSIKLDNEQLSARELPLKYASYMPPVCRLIDHRMINAAATSNMSVMGPFLRAMNNRNLGMVRSASGLAALALYLVPSAHTRLLRDVRCFKQV